jgi:YebC/PmpR family DNA-binding regulatory protein
MSGHSKWANIKIKKGKQDAVKGSVFTKMGRELAVAVKSGGPDPASNAKLRDAIAKAKQNNMPNETIARSIKKASGELNTVNYEEIQYEGYAAGGIAVIVEALTDNRNRTAGDVRHFFDKYNGSMGNTGCVSYLFKKKGLVVVEAKDGTSEDDMMMLALDAGADDVIGDGDNVYEIYTLAGDMNKVRDSLEKQGLTVLSGDIGFFPDIYVDPQQESIPMIIKLIDSLEELDDVQNVYHNANLPEEDEEE